MKKWKISLQFKKQDCWIGVFWKTSYIYEIPEKQTIFWVCIIPCFPICIVKTKLLPLSELNKAGV